MYISVLSACMEVRHMHAMPLEGQKRASDRQNLGYRWLLATV